MTGIEKIKRYIERTGLDKSDAYGMNAREWMAMCNSGGIAEAVAVAYNYGRAKGYWAARAEQRKAVRG